MIRTTKITPCISLNFRSEAYQYGQWSHSSQDPSSKFKIFQPIITAETDKRASSSNETIHSKIPRKKPTIRLGTCGSSDEKLRPITPRLCPDISNARMRTALRVAFTYRSLAIPRLKPGFTQDRAASKFPDDRSPGFGLSRPNR